ncbi:KAP family P-loop NTPase fold protein [Faecalispora anaeroviscerum]|uniref:KAP family P-loop NTPase fold protein n=1 Tax=Faecalispora anaeroviscerum TaxID=2991836 RepID=UPI0024BBD467|nr:P-loop NTPase fold protein [Faecalispora anaeroviscerum]
MWLDNASDIDILFYGPYAKLIADIAKDETNNPLTIGVFGLWGAGKSTLLNLIDQQLTKEKENIICVKINAWMFEGYEDAKTALMEALLKELYNKKPFEEVKDSIKKLFQRVDLFKLATSTVSIGASVVASVATGNPLPIAMSVPRNVKEVAEVLESAAEKVSDEKDAYIKNETTVDNIRNFRKDFEQMLINADTNNVVVIVDDLDRCTPERIIDTLEAIKLFLSVERTTFIIAADENVIQYAIRKKYPHIDGSDVELSTEYIEKIIQLPIYIPELSSKDIENYLLLLVTQRYLSSNDFKSLLEKIHAEKYIVRDARITLPEMKLLISNLHLEYAPSEAKFMEDANIIDSIRDIVSSMLKGNPRQAKRFLNTFITKKSLAQMYYGSDIDIRILAKLLVLQKLDSDLFNQLNEWNKEFTLCNDKFKTMYDAVMASTNSVEYTKWAIPSIKKWLECEPKDFYSQRLDRYFYLTRENLAGNIIDSQNFSIQARQVLDQLGSVKEGTISGIMEAMKALSPVDIDNVFSVLLPRIRNGLLGYFVIKELFLTFTPYQDKILDAVGNAKQTITLADSIYLSAMFNANTTKVLPMLERIKGGRLNAKLYDKIIGKKG